MRNMKKFFLFFFFIVLFYTSIIAELEVLNINKIDRNIYSATNYNILSTLHAYYYNETDSIYFYDVTDIYSEIYVVNPKSLTITETLRINDVKGIASAQFLQIDHELFLITIQDPIKIFKITYDEMGSRLVLIKSLSFDQQGYTGIFAINTKLIVILDNFTYISYNIRTGETQHYEEPFFPLEFLNNINDLTTNNEKNMFVFDNYTHLIFYNSNTKKIENIYPLNDLLLGAALMGINYLPYKDLFVLSSSGKSIFFYSSTGEYLANLTFSTIEDPILYPAIGVDNFNSSWLLLGTEEGYYRYYYKTKQLTYFAKPENIKKVRHIYWIESCNKYLFSGWYMDFLYNNETKQIEYIYKNMNTSTSPNILENYWMIILFGLLIITILFASTFVYYLRKK